MICRNCENEQADGVRTCQSCGAPLRPMTQTAMRAPGDLAAADPALDAAIKPALAKRLNEWAVSSGDALFVVHLVGQNYPLGRLTHLRELLDEGLIRPETPVLLQKRGKWYEAHRFPGIVTDGAFAPENTAQLATNEPTPGKEARATGEGKAVLAARLGREAEEAASAGEIVRAIAIYEEVLEINPRYPLVKRRLRELRGVRAEGTSAMAGKKASLPSSDVLPMQHEDRTTALSMNDLVEAAPPTVPGPRASLQRNAGPPRRTPDALRRESEALAASLSSSPQGPQPIDPHEPDEPTVTNVEEVLEPTVALQVEAEDVEESTTQELVFEDTPVEVAEQRGPSAAEEAVAKAPSTLHGPSRNSSEFGIEHTLDVRLSSADLPPIPDHFSAQLQITRTLDDVDWVALAVSADAAEHLDVHSLRDVFLASDHVCFLYFANELIGAARAITDGLRVATICELITSPAHPRRLLVTTLVGAMLEVLNVPTVVVLSAGVTPDVLAPFGFSTQAGVFVRQETA